MDANANHKNKLYKKVSTEAECVAYNEFKDDIALFEKLVGFKLESWKRNC